MKLGVCFQILIYLTTIKFKSSVIKWKQDQKSSVFPPQPHPLEHLELLLQVPPSNTFVGFEGNFYGRDAEARDTLTFPRVTPSAAWGRPKPLPFSQLPELTMGSPSTALGSGVQVVRVALGISTANPSSLWRWEEGKGRTWRLWDFLIPEYTFLFVCFSVMRLQQIFLFLF